MMNYRDQYLRSQSPKHGSAECRSSVHGNLEVRRLRKKIAEEEERNVLMSRSGSSLMGRI
jgi:hypothetical protein